MLFEALSIRQASSKTFHSTNILTVNIAFLFRLVAYGDAKRVKFLTGHVHIQKYLNLIFFFEHFGTII